METRSNPTVQAFSPPPDTRLVSSPRFGSRFFAFFFFICFAFSFIVQRAFPSYRPSTNDPRSRFLSVPTQTLGKNAKDDRFPLHALIEYGRWRHDCSRGRTMMQRRFVTVSPIVQPKSPGEKRTLVSRCRIIAYRPRRNRGRIKPRFNRRKTRPSEQKISEKVGHVLVHCFDHGDKTIPSTNVANSRACGLLLFFFPRLARTNPPFLVDKLYAAADQSARWAGFHDLSATIGVASHTGAKERHGPRIQRSPTRTQRESPNAKFLCQWHERVVLMCIGLFNMYNVYPTNPYSHALNSPANKTCFDDELRLNHWPFRFFLSFPAQNKQNPNAIETGQRTTPTVDLPMSHVGARKLPGRIHSRSKAKSSSLPGRMHRWFDSTITSFFPSKFPSYSGPFLWSQLTDLLSSPNRSQSQERFANGRLLSCSLSLISI